LRFFAKFCSFICKSKSEASMRQISKVCNLQRILLQIANRASNDRMIRTDALLILCHFDRFDEPNNVILSVLTLLASMSSTLACYEQFGFALLDCLKNAMAKSSIAQQMAFFDAKGVLTTIRFIEKATPSLTESALSFLLQICANKQFILKIAQHSKEFEEILIKIWRSNKERNVLQTNVHCLVAALDCAIDWRNGHKMDAMLKHFELMQGTEWKAVSQSLAKDEITSFDANNIKLKIEKYEKIKSQIERAGEALKASKDEEAKQNLNDLMQKLNLYKSQTATRQSIKSQNNNKENTILTANIKMSKEEKSKIIAQSLQIDQTMQKVLG